MTDQLSGKMCWSLRKSVSELTVFAPTAQPRVH